jgi:diguanylate cyclase (GGDEF)-like protein
MTWMDLREQVASLLSSHADIIAADAAAIFPGDAGATADDEQARRTAGILVRVLASAVRSGRVDADKGPVADLRAEIRERGVAMHRLFSFVYLVEREALDQLALDSQIGAPTESWPQVAQLVRCGSFDLLAAYTDGDGPHRTALISDPLTTLHSRAVLESALAKEVDRSARNGSAFSLLLIDVDGLGAINQEHGHGVGDQVLERLGALLRGHFRRHDWLARFSDGAFAVLLVGADAAGAAAVAENVRVSVVERLSFSGRQDGTSVPLTVTVAVLTWSPAAGISDAERLTADAEAALRRGKRGGGNRVETVTYPSRSS